MTGEKQKSPQKRSGNSICKEAGRFCQYNRY